jgi:hypothetical protein
MTIAFPYYDDATLDAPQGEPEFVYILRQPAYFGDQREIKILRWNNLTDAEKQEWAIINELSFQERWAWATRIEERNNA